jgi:hypothetical protein
MNTTKTTRVLLWIDTESNQGTIWHYGKSGSVLETAELILPLPEAAKVCDTLSLLHSVDVRVKYGKPLPRF